MTIMMSPQPNPQPPIRIRTRQWQCPSCEHIADFTFVGEQRWPHRVVEVTGIGPLVHLWMCGHCQTTITETAHQG